MYIKSGIMMAADSAVDLPGQKEFHNPTLQALKNLGGSGKVREIVNEVAELMRLSPEQRGIPHKHDHFQYANRTKWSIHRLFKIGMLSRPQRAIYALTEKGEASINIDSSRIEQEFLKRKQDAAEVSTAPEAWKSELIGTANQQSSSKAIPALEELLNPTLDSLRELGGTSRKAAITDLVVDKMQLSKEQLELRFPSGSASRFDNRMNDVRLYLLRENLICQPRVGTWQLTESGWAIGEVDVSSFRAPRMRPRRRRAMRQLSEEKRRSLNEPAVSINELFDNYSNWREDLSKILHELTTSSFERFFALIFNSEGIDQVEIVNVAGNNAIEGTMSSTGFLSFRVYFKFVRGNNLIATRDIDDFRRLVQASRSDKGLLITTGSFTQEARRESERGINPAIELIDGQQFIDKLKERSLGVETEQVMVERVVINRDFFDNL